MHIILGNPIAGATSDSVASWICSKKEHYAILRAILKHMDPLTLKAVAEELGVKIKVDEQDLLQFSVDRDQLQADAMNRLPGL